MGTIYRRTVRSDLVFNWLADVPIKDTTLAEISWLATRRKQAGPHSLAFRLIPRRKMSLASSIVSLFFQP
jgi:hypothetical protein